MAFVNLFAALLRCQCVQDARVGAMIRSMLCRLGLRVQPVAAGGRMRAGAAAGNHRGKVLRRKLACGHLLAQAKAHGARHRACQFHVIVRMAKLHRINPLAQI